MLTVDKLNNLIKQQIIAVLSTFSHTRVGQIAGYNPDTYTAKVMIQPEGLVTNYLPILTFNVGNGWGFYSAPNDGDMVLVHFMEGDFSTGFIGSKIFNSIDVPINPAPPAGETWMIHKTGTYLKFNNDGTVALLTLDSNGHKTNFNINSNVVITGNLTVSGNVLDNSGTNTNTVKDMRTIYDSHTHGGVSPGPSNTASPNQPM